MKFVRTFSLAVLFCSLATMLGAQGVQTGTVRGTVQDEQGLAVPGVTVTATSPALQGPRVVVSDASGSFVFPNLPPGAYTVKFELSGFATVNQNTVVPLGGIIQQNVTMRTAGLTETVQVVAESPAPIATPVVGINIKHEEIEALATPRTLQGIATLSPGVNEASPNAGQLVINGAFAFDNIFMINGVDVNDNLFANPQNLFIEDAIEETQVLTSGISAEYGRFGGGVVNAITKSGGNSFSGSGRVNFSNPSWSTETPFEETSNITRPDIAQQTYEGTFGGPIVRDRLWFFTAGRYLSLEDPRTVRESAVQVIQQDKNKRGELKLTGTVLANHTIAGGYLNNSRTTSNTSGIFSLIGDPASLITRSLPNSYYFTNYRGIFGGGALLEGQYSQRAFEFKGEGGPASTNLLDSPFYAPGVNAVYHAPYFCACDPEQRNNKQVTAAVTNFWSGRGTHTTKTGYEFFRSQRTGGNSQSPTQYVYNADYVVDGAGKPVRDASGALIPIFVTGESALEFYPATIGAALNIDNNSLYVQDHWAINGSWSVDLGARFERVTAVSTGDITSVRNNRIVPRFGTAYDIKGNGSHIIHMTYGQYSGRYNEAQVGGNSPVGNPAYIFSLYQGPSGQGLNFAPGIDVKNYPINADNASVSVPTANIFTDPGMKSPLIHEFTTSYGANIANGKGYAEVAYVYRNTTSMIEDFITREDGTTVVEFSGVDAGEVSNHVYRNTPDAHRTYQGMVFQSRYTPSSRWTVNGQYTVQLKNEGNYAGEGTNTPGATSRIGDYPEIFNAERYFPDGRLLGFQRHRLRAWTIYNFGMGRAGDLSLSGLWRVDSGQTFSLAAAAQPLTTIQRTILRDAGYPDAPSSATVYFDERGSEEYPGYGLLDANISYNIPVVGSVRPWVKFDIYNLLNNQKLIQFNTTVRPDPASPLDALGLRTGFLRGAAFGTGTAQTHYPVPFGGQTGGRTLRLAVGLRF